jgi:drug/metabolite transporter (DMT)-like permease
VDDAAAEQIADTRDTARSTQVESTRRNKVKVVIAMFFATIFIAFGDVSLSKGMKIVGATHFHNIVQMAGAFANVYIVAGVILQIAFLALYLASLSWEELSFVLPLTAFNYVIVTVLAFALLHEPVSPIRWMGSILVATGIAFVTRT